MSSKSARVDSTAIPPSQSARQETPAGSSAFATFGLSLEKYARLSTFFSNPAAESYRKIKGFSPS
jgi:hypothetical protein